MTASGREVPAPAAKRVSHLATPPPPVKLGNYEGPLDLLLDLIRKQQINIYDIPIAKITQQYLDYLHLMEDLNIDVAGEFIFMAATLIHIKSRMLLPPDPTAPPEEQEDPRDGIGAPAARARAVQERGGNAQLEAPVGRCHVVAAGHRRIRRGRGRARPGGIRVRPDFRVSAKSWSAPRRSRKCRSGGKK